jgi:hypothetical protein
VFSFLSSSFPSNSPITSIFTCMLSLTRIMAEISHYCWPCDRNSVHRSMLPDIALHPIARSSSRSQWKCYGNWSLQYLHVVVEGHWTSVWYCCCCSLNCWISVFFFFFGFFSMLKVFPL